LENFLLLTKQIGDLSEEIGMGSVKMHLDSILFKLIEKGSIIQGVTTQTNLIRVNFPLDFFKELKYSLLVAPKITSNTMELVGLIDYITYGVKKDIFYFVVK
jgi:hypothetical protein